MCKNETFHTFETLAYIPVYNNHCLQESLKMETFFTRFGQHGTPVSGIVKFSEVSAADQPTYIHYWCFLTQFVLATYTHLCSRTIYTLVYS